MRDAQGHQLRTLVTAPKRVQGRVSAIFFVGWLSCDSLEYPDGGTDGFGAIFWRLIETSGCATMRLDKPGVGESSGDCCKTDFQTELSGYRAAFDSLGKYPFVDLDHVFVVGLSNGGGVSPLVAQGHPIRGYLVRAHAGAGAGTGARSLKLRWQEDARGNQLRPETIHGFLFAVSDSQNGAPRNQLSSIPTGPISGTTRSASDSRAIADIVNRVHPGQAAYLEIPAADRLLAIHGRPSDEAVPEMLQWMRARLTSRP